jgi:SLOG cluster2
MEKEVNTTGISGNIADSIDKDILAKKDVLQDQELLTELRVGISISDSPDLFKLGYSMMHLQDASIEFARYLLVHGATMIYGGDLKKDGFTNLFSELARLYTIKDRSKEFRFKNYFAWPIHLQLEKSNELDFKQNKVEIIKLPPPASVKADPSQYLARDTNEAKAIWAKSLAYMRQQMNAGCDARIFLGGKTKDFGGKYPGVIEEALYALKDNKPVYFIGAYGGATKEIINLINNQAAEVMTEGYQIADKDYAGFYNYWNSNEADKINYTELSGFFKEYGLQKICQANGLDEEENQRLFTTNNLTEMIFYVLKGLTKIKN